MINEDVLSGSLFPIQAMDRKIIRKGNLCNRIITKTNRIFMIKNKIKTFFWGAAAGVMSQHIIPISSNIRCFSLPGAVVFQSLPRSPRVLHSLTILGGFHLF